VQQTDASHSLPCHPRLADLALPHVHLLILPLPADLGRTPDWLNNEHAQNNTLCSISYWQSVEELEAFARTPLHIKSLKFLFSVGMGPKGHELGVIVRTFPASPPPSSHARAYSPASSSTNTTLVSHTSARGYGLSARALGGRVQQH
jgi:hypothetical protein